MIKAKGYKGSTLIEVSAELLDGEIVIEPEEYQQEYRDMATEQDPIGGTYYPDVNTLLCAYNVLENHFFDSLESIEVDGDLEEIPNEKDLVY